MFPELIRIGDFFLPTYGVLVATGFLLALALASRLGKQDGLDPDAVVNLGIYCALAGIVGAKLLYFVIDDSYRRDPSQIFTFATLQTGGVFYGGLILALIVAFVYMRSKKLPPLRTSDAFAPGIALGHGIGRLGCFAAGCCWGDRCDLPWAVTFTNPRANELVGVPLNVALHPTQIYEAIAEFAIFGVLIAFIKKPHRPGSVIALYLVLYSTARFIVEFVRVHDQGNPFGWALNQAQWISIGLLILGAFLWMRGRRLSLSPR